jgi:DNA-binding winged helix-turn-helix (wHTH) protein
MPNAASSRPEIERIFIFDEFCLDHERLRRSSSSVPIPSKAFRLLRHLVAHVGETISKGDLIAAVWSDADASDESLARCVHVARSALGDLGTGAPRYIETVYGSGYRFIGTVHVRNAAQPADAAWGSEAFDRCIQARQHLSRRLHSVDVALALYEEAVHAQPNFPEALAGLAECHLYRAMGEAIKPKVAASLALPLLMQSIGLDPGHARTLALLGHYHSIFTWDTQRASTFLAAAVVADPFEPAAHFFLGRHLMTLGQFGDARNAFARCARLDASSFGLHLLRVLNTFCAGDLHKALRMSRDLSELHPNHVLSMQYGTAIAALAGERDEALAGADALVRLGSKVASSFAYAGYAYALCGRSDRARAAQDRMKHVRSGSAVIAPSLAALPAIGIGDIDEAFRWLDLAVSEGCCFLPSTAVVQCYAPLWHDRRYAAIAHAIGRDAPVGHP